jgi:hypothetical protein
MICSPEIQLTQGAWQKHGCEQFTHTIPASRAAPTRLNSEREPYGGMGR